MNIHCLNKIAQVGLDLFDEKYQLVEEMDQADGVLVRSAAMQEMTFPKSLLAIGRAGAGVNNIPLDRCADQGIVVFNTPGANANGVKELVVGALMLASRGIIDGVNWVQTQQDNPEIAKATEKMKSQFAGQEVAGKKLGVIGLGAIGVLVANAANSLGMEVYGCDPYLSVDHAWRLSRSINPAKSREEIFRECDYITLHVPAMEETKGMINKEALDMMKEGVVLLNFSRDTLVQEDAMEQALESGKVARYVVDFPNPKTVKMKNTIVIPHLGASTEESEDNCAKMAVRELRNYIEYGNIINSVNFPNCDAGFPEEGNKRITVLHKNVPNMLSQFTTVFGTAGINIDHMINKSRGEYAYSIFDYAGDAQVEPLVEKLNDIDSVLRVRVLG